MKKDEIKKGLIDTQKIKHEQAEIARAMIYKIGITKSSEISGKINAVRYCTSGHPGASLEAIAELNHILYEEFGDTFL